jgi:2,4-didehydro-3-deoxy-L-rhamnonate hydrolase
MRLCRFEQGGHATVGFYDEKFITPLEDAAHAYHQATGEAFPRDYGDHLLAYLPPEGPAAAGAAKLAAWLETEDSKQVTRLPTGSVQLLVPVPNPPKLFLLAGNFADHIREGGGVAAERAETFPYVFMKPPTTTLTDPGRPVRIPGISPDHIDWECELAVVIGRRAKGVSEAEALDCVAGYTVINDISNRKFRPNPGRKQRDKDGFFDWLHGKWHDSFCPCGPCLVSPAAIPDPQTLKMQLRVNDRLHQDGSTAQQIFPVAAVIEFISSFVTLEPGDIISTGTPAGVGNTTGVFLQPGDKVTATIERIGTLATPVTAEP